MRPIYRIVSTAEIILQNHNRTKHHVCLLKIGVIKNKTSWIYHSGYYISVVILERKINKGTLTRDEKKKKKLVPQTVYRTSPY